MPKSIEAYYQETGRAGRDGDPAEAHLFWGVSDFSRARQWLSEVEPDRLAGEQARLNSLAALVETPECRRAILLRHFGEHPPARCGNCDNCENPPTMIDATEIGAQAAVGSLSHRAEFRHRPYRKGADRAERRVAITRARTQTGCRYFGIVAPHEAALLRPLARTLTARGMLAATEHGGLKCSAPRGAQRAEG